MLTLLCGFDSIDAAGGAVSAIIARGIMPAAVEMMDRLTIEAAEAAVHPRFPDANAVLIVELDGPQAEVDEQFAVVESVCRELGATSVEIARDPASANGSGKAARPRSRRWDACRRTTTCRTASCRAPGCPRCCGGSVSSRRVRAFASATCSTPATATCTRLICYDESIPGQAEHAEEVASEILMYCIDAGGSLTGEHGIGVDKKAHMPKMFTDDDLDAMQLVRCAFDPSGICNPGKVFPTPRLCGEVPGPYRQHPLERAGIVERF